MNKIDEKILLALIANSRQSISQIAKQARVSRDVANYRVQQLHAKGVIRDFITNINFEKLGYISAMFFISLKADAEKEFIEYINNLPFVSWAGTNLGIMSLGMAIYGKNTQEIEQHIQTILQKYKHYITNHKFALYKTTTFFTEKYFGGKIAPQKKIKEYEYHVDTIDKILLKNLAKNSRISVVELAKIVKLTPVAVAKRIDKLEKSDYIQGYSIYINIFKIDMHLFTFFIQNRNLDQRKKLISYLEHHPNVVLMLDYIGDPFIEFGIGVKNPYDVRAVLQEIKETFPENQVIDFFITQDDFISFGAPRCVFE